MIRDIGEIFFYSIVATIIIFFFRIVFINIKIRRYIKKYHRDFWDNNIHLFWGGGKGGPNIFQLVKRLNDPKIGEYKREWDKALKQLFLVTVIIILLVIVLIYFGVV